MHLCADNFLIFLTIVFSTARYSQSDDIPAGTLRAKLFVKDLVSGTFSALKDDKSEKEAVDEKRFNALINDKMAQLKDQIKMDPRDLKGETRKLTNEIQMLLEKKLHFEVRRKNFLGAALLRQAKIWVEKMQVIVESEKEKPLDNETAKRLEHLQILFNLVESYLVKVASIG